MDVIKQEKLFEDANKLLDVSIIDRLVLLAMGIFGYNSISTGSHLHLGTPVLHLFGGAVLTPAPPKRRSL
jgi:hypothetical protein